MHYFKFSTNWQDGKRLCGECSNKYLDGEHIEVNLLKPYTSYVCPDAGDGRDVHSSVWSGAQDVPELRTPTGDKCSCGQTLIEEDSEKWTVSWEMLQGDSWRPVSATRSKHAATQQHRGLLALIEQGEAIRNVRLETP